MTYHVLHPDLARHLLEGEVDEVSSAHDARIAKIKAMPCPRCHTALQPRLDARVPFSEHSPLPRMVAICECGVELDVETGLVIDRGSAAKVVDPLPLITEQP